MDPHWFGHPDPHWKNADHNTRGGGGMFHKKNRLALQMNGAGPKKNVELFMTR
jgi:hypothetical protein